MIPYENHELEEYKKPKQKASKKELKKIKNMQKHIFTISISPFWHLPH